MQSDVVFNGRPKVHLPTLNRRALSFSPSLCFTEQRQTLQTFLRGMLKSLDQDGLDDTSG
jgi:hypothetical protein